MIVNIARYTQIGLLVPLIISGCNQPLNIGGVEGSLTGSVPQDRLAISQKEAHFLSVSDYGAKGDGVSDDSGPLQSALAAGIALKAPVFFPKGTYCVERGLEIMGDLRMFAKSLATLKICSGSPPFILRLQSEDLHRIAISGLTFDGNGRNSGAALLIFEGAKPLHFSANTVQNSSSAGLWVFNNNQDVFIEKSRFLNNANTCLLIQGVSNGTTGLPRIENINLHVASNLIDGCKTQNGIYVQAALQNVTIRENTVKNVGDEGIELGGPQSPAGGGDYGVMHCLLKNNYIESVGNNGGSGSAGIILTRTSDCTIRGGIVKGINPRTMGIQVRYSSQNILIDTSVEDALGAALSMSGDTAGTTGQETSISNIKVRLRVNNHASPAGALNLFDTSLLNIEVEDSSTAAQTVKVANSALSSKVLRRCFLNYKSKTPPLITMDEGSWGFYYTVSSESGFSETNIPRGSNVIKNSDFVANSTVNWQYPSPVSVSFELPGEATVTSTQAMAFFENYIQGFAKQFAGQQFELSFDYMTADTDSYVELVTTDGIRQVINYSVGLRPSPSSFTTITAPFIVDNSYDDLSFRLAPTTSSDAGSVTVRNLRIFIPEF